MVPDGSVQVDSPRSGLAQHDCWVAPPEDDRCVPVAQLGSSAQDGSAQVDWSPDDCWAQAGWAGLQAVAGLLARESHPGARYWQADCQADCQVDSLPVWPLRVSPEALVLPAPGNWPELATPAPDEERAGRDSWPISAVGLRTRVTVPAALLWQSLHGLPLLAVGLPRDPRCWHGDPTLPHVRAAQLLER